MPDHPDTTDSVPAQEPAPDADNRFGHEIMTVDERHAARIAIDACAAVADAYVAAVARYPAMDQARIAAREIRDRIRALKSHV